MLIGLQPADYRTCAWRPITPVYKCMAGPYGSGQSLMRITATSTPNARYVCESTAWLSI